MKIDKDTSEKEEFSGLTEPYVDKIAKLLKIPKKDLLETSKTKNFINDILQANPENKKLALYIISEVDPSQYVKLTASLKKDPDIILALLQKTTEYLHFVPKEIISKSILLGKIILSTMVRTGTNILSILLFLEKYFNKSTENPFYSKLFEFLTKTVKKSENIYEDDLSNSMLKIKSENEVLFNLLSEKAIETKGKKLTVRLDLIKNFHSQLSINEEYEEAEELAKRQIEFDTIIKILGIKVTFLNPDSIYAINNIQKICISNESLARLKIKKASIRDEISHIDSGEDEDELDTDIDAKDKLAFCLPSCQYAVEDSGDVIIRTVGNREIRLSENEADRFSSLGLQNFITFYNMLTDLGLNFLWDKHKTKFAVLLNNSIDFDYPSAAGVTESRALRVFNFILRNAGGLHKEDKNYKTLDGARIALKTINDSRIIGNTHFAAEFSGGSPIEMVFKTKGLINNGELDTSAFTMYGEESEDKPEETSFLETILPLSYVNTDNQAANDDEYKLAA